MTTGQIVPNNEPFFLPGGPTGCLLVHGFTGTPKEMRKLGDYLHGLGHTVLGVRLAGHATNLEDMIRTNYTHWLASVEDGVHLLKGITKRIFIMGLSMGGVLSLTQAARLPQADLPLAGVVAMSTPYQFPKPWVRKAPWLLPLISPVYTKEVKKNKKDWFNPEAAEGHYSYEANPTRSAHQLYQMLGEMRAGLPKIEIPALIIHSKDDAYVLEENAQPLFDHIGSQEKQLVWTDHANHVITVDGDLMRVFEPIKAFIEKYT